MPGATYVLDKTYKVTAAVVAFVAVIEDGTTDGLCKLPTAANQHAAGITQAPQATASENVQVRVLGISRAKANSAIHAGDPVRIAATTGFLESATLATAGGTAHKIVGWALSSAAVQGDIFNVLLWPFVCEGS